MSVDITEIIHNLTNVPSIFYSVLDDRDFLFHCLNQSLWKTSFSSILFVPRFSPRFLARISVPLVGLSRRSFNLDFRCSLKYWRQEWTAWYNYSSEDAVFFHWSFLWLSSDPFTGNRSSFDQLRRDLQWWTASFHVLHPQAELSSTKRTIRLHKGQLPTEYKSFS